MEFQLQKTHANGLAIGAAIGIAICVAFGVQSTALLSRRYRFRFTPKNPLTLLPQYPRLLM